MLNETNKGTVVRRKPRSYLRVVDRPGGGPRIHVRLYQIWRDMLNRCNNPNVRSYADYGARGIKVCAEWRKDYPAFRAWAIANGYTKTGTIDRKDINRGYEPNNCQWLPLGQQQLNTRRVIRITFGGVTKPLPLWAREIGLSMEALRQRKRKGWPDHHALTVPKGGRCPGFPYQRPGRKAAQSSSEGLPNTRSTHHE